MDTVLPRRVAFVLIGAAALLRLATLTHHSLWLDEVYSVMSPWRRLAMHLDWFQVDPIHPPLYYVILQKSIVIFGMNEVGARLPSALASIANIALVWTLGRRLLPASAVGRTAAVLLALAPLDFWYAQEARMYELVTSAGLLLALGLVIDEWWAALLIVAGLAGGLYLDHTMWPIALLLISAWAVWSFLQGMRATSMARVLLAVTAAFACCGPVWRQAIDVYAGLDKVSLFKNISHALGIHSVTVVPFAGALALFAVGCLGVIAIVWSQLRTRRPLWIAPAISAGFIALTMAGAIPRAYTLKQVLVCVWPFAVMAAAWSLNADRAARRIVATIAVSCASIAVTFFTPRADWRGVAARVDAYETRRAAIVLDPPYNADPFEFYSVYRPVRVIVRGPVESRDALGNAAEACVIAERFGSKPPTSKTEAWMDANLRLTRVTTFARLELRCYDPK